VDRLEQALAGQPCIGELSRWERHYQVAIQRPWPYLADTNHIRFAFFQAGVDGFVSGRRIESNSVIMSYDGNAQVADGVYDVRTGVVTVDYCGSNSPSAPPAPANRP
jgi:hypothetical protein